MFRTKNTQTSAANSLLIEGEMNLLELEMILHFANQIVREQH